MDVARGFVRGDDRTSFVNAVLQSLSHLVCVNGYLAASADHGSVE
jgi:hypothetical protein